MNTCKDCKFWSKDWEEKTENGNVHICTKVKMFWDCTEWSKNYTGRKVLEEFKDDKAFVKDGSDYKALLMTMESFGCNQFEAK